jgi:hypothetical protein
VVTLARLDLLSTALTDTLGGTSKNLLISILQMNKLKKEKKKIKSRKGVPQDIKYHLHDI